MALTEEGLISVPGFQSRYVRLANGARAHYHTAGETGPPVILLHGGLAGSSGLAGWRYLAPFLGANGFRVYCPDMPGFGLADTREEYWPVHGLASHTEFIDMFADALCLDRFFLSGNSMGCMNTVQYLCAYPYRVIRYILIAGGIGDAAPLHMNMDVFPPFDGTTESMRKMMDTIIYKPQNISEEYLEMRTAAGNRQAQSYSAHMGAMLKSVLGGDDDDSNLSVRMTTKGRIDKLTLPGIYLYGKDDVLIPIENAYAQEDALPNVQFFYPSECGHQIQTDQPDLTNQIYLEFFRDGRVSRETADRAGVSTRRPEIPALVEQR